MVPPEYPNYLIRVFVISVAIIYPIFALVVLSYNCQNMVISYT